MCADHDLQRWPVVVWYNRNGESAIGAITGGTHHRGHRRFGGRTDAFARFFQHTPANSGLAFVLIQHLDPNHQSLLAETIATSTTMPVRQAEEGMALQPDHVYTIPPGSDLVMRQGRFHLLERPAPRTLHLPIDTFFRSLAEEQKERAIAIVLSGTGSDGTLGLGAIKEQGGIVVVQDPATAGFDGMPRSAIATGLADLILPPEADGGTHPGLRAAAVRAGPEAQAETAPPATTGVAGADPECAGRADRA